MLLKIVLAGLCVAGSAGAQSSPPASGNPPVAAPKPIASATVPDRYASEAAVIEHLATVYRYAADGTGSKQITLVVRAQTEAAVRQLGVITVPFASAEEHVEFDYVRVRRPEGTVVETPASEAQEMSSEVTRQAPLYSDLKEKQLPVRSLRAGDTLEYQVRVVRTVAQAANEIWGSHYQSVGIVVLDETTEIRLPSTKSLTVWSPTSKPVMKDENGERIYRWAGSQLVPTAGPEADKKKEAEKTRTLTPAEAADLQFGKLPLIAWTTFKSWDAVGAWYRSLEAGRTVADPDIKAKVAELVAGKTTDEEKIRAIYNYVATSIRYIGVDLGVGRYQPHLASEVLRNQYGDCKDKHTLLAAMLLQAGFDPSAVLVGVNIRFNPDVPSPASFNHAITQVAAPGTPDGKAIWLDSTQEVAPYRALLSVVRDKDVLVIPAGGVSRIEKTPATLPYPSVDRFEATATLSAEGTAESHIVITSRGDGEILFRELAHQISPGQYDEFVQRLSQGIGFGGTASHAEISRPESTADPIRIAYDYKREKAGDWDNLRIVPQIPALFMPVVDEKDPPKIPIQLGEARTETVATTMKLPEGWGATLPADIHVKTPFALFDKTYRLEKGTLYADRKLEILKKELPAAEWKTYKKFTEDISLNNENWVQLTTVVVTQLSAAVRNEEALASLSQLTPDQRKEAEKNLRDRLSHVGTDDSASIQLASLLSGDGDYPAAIAVLQAANTASPDKAPIQIALGRTYLKAGKIPEGTAVFTGLIKTSADVGILNDSAYELANANLELDLAETTVRKALDKFAQDSVGLTLDADSEKALAATRLTIASWDTLGWILFRQQKLNDAEPYIRAAWLQSEHAEVGLHLAQIQEAQGKLEEALATYKAAASAIHRYGPNGQALPPSPVAKEIAARVAAIYANNPRLGKLPAEPTIPVTMAPYSSGSASPPTPRFFQMPVPVLQQLRTIQLGSSGGMHGVREFTVILSASGVADAVATGTQPELKNDDAIVRRLETRSWWPANSPVKILRQGVLTCQDDKCEFVYIPL